MLLCSASAPGSLFIFTIVLFPGCALLISPTSWIFCPRISWSDEVGLFPVCSPRNSGEVRPRKNRIRAETSQTVVHLRENEVAPSQMLLCEIFSERLKCLACGDVTFPRKSSRFRLSQRCSAPIGFDSQTIDLSRLPRCFSAFEHPFAVSL